MLLTASSRWVGQSHLPQVQRAWRVGFKWESFLKFPSWPWLRSQQVGANPQATPPHFVCKSMALISHAPSRAMCCCGARGSSHPPRCSRQRRGHRSTRRQPQTPGTQPLPYLKPTQHPRTGPLGQPHPAQPMACRRRLKWGTPASANREGKMGTAAQDEVQGTGPGGLQSCVAPASASDYNFFRRPADKKEKKWHRWGTVRCALVVHSTQPLPSLVHHT